MLFVKLEFSLRSWKCISWRNCCLKDLSPIAWQRERNQLKSLGGYPEWKWLLMSGVANYLLSCCWVWLFHQTVVRNVKDVVFTTLWPFLFFWRKTFVCASRVEIFNPQGALRLKLPELDLLGWNYVDSLQSTETKDAPFLRRTWRRRKWLHENSVRSLCQYPAATRLDLLYCFYFISFLSHLLFSVKNCSFSWGLLSVFLTSNNPLQSYFLFFLGLVVFPVQIVAIANRILDCSSKFWRSHIYN